MENIGKSSYNFDSKRHSFPDISASNIRIAFACRKQLLISVAQYIANFYHNSTTLYAVPYKNPSQNSNLIQHYLKKLHNASLKPKLPNRPNLVKN